MRIADPNNTGKPIFQPSAIILRAPLPGFSQAKHITSIAVFWCDADSVLRTQ